MCSHIRFVDDTPSSYKAKRDFSTKSGDINVEEGDKISPEEYDRLFFKDQDNF